MKRKIKLSVCILFVYILLNILAYGLIKVYTTSYNTLNKDKIQMAEISVQKSLISISVTDREVTLDMEKLHRNDWLPFSAYVLASGELKSAIRLVSEIKDYIPLTASGLTAL